MTRAEYIATEIARFMKRRQRMKPGARRDRLSRFIGSLEFARLQAEHNDKGR